MTEPWHSLLQLVTILGTLLGALLQFLLQWSLLIAWLAWWLVGVNWKKAWTALAQGAWAPVVLLMIIAALVWSRLAPSDRLGVPNFWWQLGAVSLLAALTLLCGWLQGVFGWTPAEINLEPPVAHGHGGHGHHH